MNPRKHLRSEMPLMTLARSSLTHSHPTHANTNGNTILRKDLYYMDERQIVIKIRDGTDLDKPDITKR